ncbi:putative small nuclear ribonucleoprotein F [Babesia divergens]|uniref:Small nuclear ribonucleoprotein F n=1 Tax=Babesia divergens TaxID=32595 RepID=A0AAD9LI28_BABDI|nr:putative small nuclear ribonucleoprotein F [Babesia divergens]
METYSPSSYIANITRKPVVVKLNNGTNFRGMSALWIRHNFILHNHYITGILSSLDDRMNLAMENTKEYVEGVFVKNYGDAFIRGNNGNRTHNTYFTNMQYFI